MIRSHRHRGGIQRLVVPAAIMVWAFTSFASAQTATAPELKAAFLYNFAKFVEWPADVFGPGQKLSLCVVGDSAVSDALEQTIKGHAIEGHELTVQVLKLDGPIRSCHLLYVTGLDSKRSGLLLDTVQGASVFTVSDSDKFAERGGVAQLVLENDRIRFVVNVAAAKRGRLDLSSKLLSLAKIVKDQNSVQ